MWNFWLTNIEIAEDGNDFGCPLQSSRSGQPVLKGDEMLPRCGCGRFAEIVVTQSNGHKFGLCEFHKADATRSYDEQMKLRKD